MSTRSHPPGWSRASKVLHWLIAALILVMAILGLTMVNLPNTPTKVDVYALHKSLGITIFLLVLIRLGWRLRAGAPPPVAGTPALQHRAATGMHLLLYLLLLAMPLTGWLLNSATGFPLQWFGLVDLPAPFGRNEALLALFTNAHVLLFWTLALLVVLHAAAAVYHHLFVGDATLARMLPDGWLQAGQPEAEREDHA